MAAAAGPFPPLRSLAQSTQHQRYFKPNATIRQLDPTPPTQPALIRDWLVDFRALVGPSYSTFLTTPRPSPSTFRTRYNINPTISDTAIQHDPLYRHELQDFESRSNEMFSKLVPNIAWTSDPQLKRQMHGTPTEHGFEATHDGHGVYQWLAQRGALSSDLVQAELMYEWSQIELSSRGPAFQPHWSHADVTSYCLFRDASTCDSVIETLQRALDNYECVPQQPAAASRIFIDAMLGHLIRDVPQASWQAHNQFSATGDYPTRSEWLSAASRLLRNCGLVARHPLIVPANGDTYSLIGSLAPTNNDPSYFKQRRGQLHVASARRSVLPASGRPPLRQSAFPPGLGQPTAHRTEPCRQRIGTCPFCPCRGCGNVFRQLNDKSACSVFGGAPLVDSASADNKLYVETFRGFLRNADDTYHAPPYLRDAQCRSAHHAMAHGCLNTTHAVPLGTPIHPHSQSHVPRTDTTCSCPPAQHLASAPAPPPTQMPAPHETASSDILCPASCCVVSRTTTSMLNLATAFHLLVL